MKPKTITTRTFYFTPSIVKMLQFVIVATVIAGCCLSIFCANVLWSGSPPVTNRDIYIGDDQGDLHRIAPIRGVCSYGGQVEAGKPIESAQIWERRKPIHICVSSSLITVPCPFQRECSSLVRSYVELDMKGGNPRYELSTDSGKWRLIKVESGQWVLRQMRKDAPHRVYIIDRRD